MNNPFHDASANRIKAHSENWQIGKPAWQQSNFGTSSRIGLLLCHSWSPQKHVLLLCLEFHRLVDWRSWHEHFLYHCSPTGQRLGIFVFFQMISIFSDGHEQGSMVEWLDPRPCQCLGPFTSEIESCLSKCMSHYTGSICKRVKCPSGFTIWVNTCWVLNRNVLPEFRTGTRPWTRIVRVRQTLTIKSSKLSWRA